MPQHCPWHGASCRGHRLSSTSPPALESSFEVAATSVRFGPGCTAELGHDVAQRAPKRVMVVSDPTIAGLRGGPLDTALASLSRHAPRADVHVFSDVEIEPTDASLHRAIAAAAAYSPDVFVAVGGGSVIDTAKAANLYSTFPNAAFLDFVNAPVGKGLPIPGPLKPLFAVPTTAGTGSETTGVVIFDHAPSSAKTGIASRLLKVGGEGVQSGCVSAVVTPPHSPPTPAARARPRGPA